MISRLLVFLLLAVSSAAAQQPSPPPPGSQSSPLVATLAVTTASARVALPASIVGYPWALLLNDGASEIFVAVGDNTVVATTTNYAIPAGRNYAVFLPQGTTSVAAITATGGSTLRISQWNGQPWAGGGSGGGVGVVITGSATVGDLTCIGPGTTQAQDCGQLPNIGAPILIGPQLTSALPGGPLGTNAVAITNGSLNIWLPQTYAWGGSAAGLCVLVGETYQGPSGGINNQCPITGNIGGGEPASGYARYPLRDSVVGAFLNRATVALIGARTGTFSATQFFPNVPFSSGDIAKFRTDMPVDTNDSPPDSARLTSWALNGTSITVAGGWYSQNCVSIPCTPVTPSGTTATIGNVTKIYGLNVVSERDTGGQTATAGVAIEADVITIVDDASSDQQSIPNDGGINIANLSGINSSTMKQYRASFGLLVTGAYNSQISLTGDSTNGVSVSPAAGKAVTYGYHAFGSGVSVAFFAQTAQEAFRSSTTAGDINVRILSTGNAEWGEQTTAAGNNTQAYFSSASGAGKPDALWTYSGGTGNNDGTMTLAAGSMFTNAVTYFGDSSAATPATGAIAITGISSAPTMSVGSGALWLTNAGGLHLTGDGSSNDVVITNKNNGAVITIPTGTTTATFGGAINAPSLASTGTAASALCVTSAGSVFTKSSVNCF